MKSSTAYFDRSDSNVAKRECSDCGGELVLAVRANQSQPSNGELNQMGSASTNWRCSTCGSTFTAAQLRGDKRERGKNLCIFYKGLNFPWVREEIAEREKRLSIKNGRARMISVRPFDHLFFVYRQAPQPANLPTASVRRILPS